MTDLEYFKLSKPQKMLRGIGSFFARIPKGIGNGIRKLGKGLIPAAYTGDGLIEAVDLPEARFVTAVQWHPESLGDRYAEAQAIFHAFAEACRA